MALIADTSIYPAPLDRLEPRRPFVPATTKGHPELMHRSYKLFRLECVNVNLSAISSVNPDEDVDDEFEQVELR
jgi:hypothetical protein